RDTGAPSVLYSFPTRRSSDLFLFQVAELAGEFARKRERLAVDHCEFLAELFVLALDFLRHGRVEFALVDHLGDVLDRHHLPFKQDRKSTRLNSSHVKNSYAVF